MLDCQTCDVCGGTTTIWIECRSRMPENGVEVLTWMTDPQLEKSFAWVARGGDPLMDYASHWMPIKPPGA